MLIEVGRMTLQGEHRPNINSYSLSVKALVDRKFLLLCAQDPYFHTCSTQQLQNKPCLQAKYRVHYYSFSVPLFHKFMASHKLVFQFFPASLCARAFTAPELLQPRGATVAIEILACARLAIMIIIFALIIISLYLSWVNNE